MPSSGRSPESIIFESGWIGCPDKKHLPDAAVLVHHNLLAQQRSQRIMMHNRAQRKKAQRRRPLRNLEPHGRSNETCLCHSCIREASVLVRIVPCVNGHPSPNRFSGNRPGVSSDAILYTSSQYRTSSFLQSLFQTIQIQSESISNHLQSPRHSLLMNLRR